MKSANLKSRNTLNIITTIKMITFDKINDAYANILNDGKQIGRLEKYTFEKFKPLGTESEEGYTIHEHYIVELFYKRYKVELKHKDKMKILILACIKSEMLLHERQKRIMSYEWKDFKKFRVKE